MCYKIKLRRGLYQKKGDHKKFAMKARHLISVLAIFMACLLLPSHAGQTQEGAGACPKPSIKSISPRAGRPGDLVNIRGARFGRPRGEVFFVEESNFPMDILVAPTVKAEILSWTFHHISVLVPKSAVTGSLYVRVHCGAVSNKVNFTVNK